MNLKTLIFLCAIIVCVVFIAMAPSVPAKPACQDAARYVDCMEGR